VLVLSRKVGDKIKIGDDVYVTIVNIRGGTIRVGIDAPRETKVIRSEIEVSE
jgi:carbon storage regulator